jgi:hypothetical protein
MSVMPKMRPRGLPMPVESLEFWKNLFEISGVVLLLLTFVAGAGVLWFSRRLNAIQAEQLRQFDKGLTDAKLELGRQQERAANADARVAGLEADAANAKSEMAKQQTRAATAERDLLQLQTRLAHRRIGPDEQTKLAAKLLPYAGSIVAVTKLGESEAGRFADDLLAVFAQAKWDVKLTFAGTMSPPPYGLQCIIDTRTKAGQALADVLRQLPPVDIREAHRNPPNDVIVGTIVVGLKPPA